MHTLGMIGANLVYSLVLIVGLSTGCQREQPTEESSSWIPPALAEEDTAHPEGRDVILRLTDFMSRQQEFMTEALTTYGAVQESGQKLHFDLLQLLAVRKPGQLYWKTLRDNATIDTAWFSDGQFTMYKEPADVWGRIRGPWNIPEMISLLRDEYNLDIPFQDLLADDAAFFGVDLPDTVPTTHQERAYTSPIWYTPGD